MRTMPFGIPRGLRVEIDFRHNTRLYLGLYEIELNRWLRRFCTSGTACFDVGADIGYDALVMAHLGASRVISFECVEESVARIRRSFDANPDLARRLGVRHARVGAATTHEAVALDDVAFADEGFVPDLIKIDVEGAEQDVLLGSHRIIADRMPHLIVETHSADLEERCSSLLVEAGYNPVVVKPRRWVGDNRPAAHNRWLVAAGQVGRT